MSKADSFLSDFESLVQAFDRNAVVCVSTLTARYNGVAFSSHHVVVTASDEPLADVVCSVRADDKATAIKELASRLRVLYAGQPVRLNEAKGSATEQQRQQLLALIKRGCIDRSVKTKVLIGLYQWSEQKAAAKIDELQLAVEGHQTGPFGLTGGAYTIPPAA